MESAEQGRARRAIAALKRLDSGERIIALARAGRRRLPGDHRYGDSLSLTGDHAPALIGRGLTAMGEERPSALREVGMGALQVWQSLSEAQGRGQGDEEVAILFTDLVGFSEWVLDAGDEEAVALLREVGEAVERPVRARGGRVVKRLGDGLMAVFDDPGSALDATLEASEAVRALKANGYEPELRAGIHYGKPRKLGSDYFGIDVNVAARVADAAGPSEVLVSETVCEHLGDAGVSLRRQWRFKAQGTPKGLKVFSAEAGRP